MKEIFKRLNFIIEQARNLDPADQKQLLDLTDTLETELDELAKTHQGQAKTISSFAQQAAEQKLEPRQSSDADNDDLLENLETSIKEFEVSHPTLTSTVQSIVNTLSNMGI